MNKAITVGRSPTQIPEAIADFLSNPALWRGENPKEYMDLLLAIAGCVEAVGIVPWLLVGEVTHQTWEIRRFGEIAKQVVLRVQVEIVEELLKSTYDSKDAFSDTLYIITDARNEARRWLTDLAFAKQLDERLAARGHDRSSILAEAYKRCAAELQAIDKSVASLELRRRATLREIAEYDRATARRLERKSQEIIEGEFSEAAE